MDGARVEPNEWLPGGEATNTLLFGINAFSLPAPNTSREHELEFFTGNSFFTNNWVQAPASTESRDGLGPLFNARSCVACHQDDGRGRPPIEGGELEPTEPFVGLLLRLGVANEQGGAPLPDPIYGAQLQTAALADVPVEGMPSVRYRVIDGRYEDGESYALLEPQYEIGSLGYGSLSSGLRVSARVAPAVFAMGLLEAIADDRLDALADPDDRNEDGISGRSNLVPDVARGEMVRGRFGWKAEQPTVRQQAAAAFLGDLGITSNVFPDQNCEQDQSACLAAPAGGAPEIDDNLLDRVETYCRILGVPARAEWDTPIVLRGKQLFHEAGCASCHVPQHVTGELEGFPELSQQSIWPYTDLLLHDLGPELSDDRPAFEATGAEWRTPPLWSLRLYAVVNGHNRLLHDGRARGVAEAILWHGGEAEQAREAFRTMTAEDRVSLVTFVESL